MFLRCIFLFTSALSLSACAGVVTAFKNDPLQSYDVPGATVYAMTGDRRTAVFFDTARNWRYCAESLPDAVAAYAAASSAKLRADQIRGGSGVEVGFGDATSVGLLQTFQRTEIAEVSRQMGWNLCLAWTQGGITNDQYYSLLDKLVTGSVDVMKTRSGQTPPAPVVVNPLTINAQSPTINTTPLTSPAPTPTPMPTPTPTPT